MKRRPVCDVYFFFPALLVQGRFLKEPGEREKKPLQLLASSVILGFAVRCEEAVALAKRLSCAYRGDPEPTVPSPPSSAVTPPKLLPFLPPPPPFFLVKSNILSRTRHAICRSAKRGNQGDGELRTGGVLRGGVWGGAMTRRKQ